MTPPLAAPTRYCEDRERTYVRLIGEIQHALNQALTEEHAKRGLTRAQIATLLGKNKSFVTRKLSGSSNMTLETLADLAYALNRPVKIHLPDRDLAPSSAPAPDPFREFPSDMRRMGL